MSNYQRFFIGSIGGLTPVFMFLYAVDFERYFNDTSTLKLIGYCVRVIILFFVGGFVAYLHNDENKPFKLFEIGMGAPLSSLVTLLQHRFLTLLIQVFKRLQISQLFLPHMQQILKRLLMKLKNSRSL